MGELIESIKKKYASQNRMRGFLLELTHRCCCDCIHCLQNRNPSEELSLDEITGLLEQLKEEGVIYLGLSGGEPFLRKDFPEILEAAKENQFIITLLTSGVLIKKPEADLLKRMNIRNVEISLLGSNPDTHDSIMNMKGAFEKIKTAVKYLRDADINVLLKCTLLKNNYTELIDIKKTARSLNAAFSASMLVSPKVDGNRSPQHLALGKEELSMIDVSLVTGGLIPGEEFKFGTKLKCTAGSTIAGMSPTGDLYPCIILRHKVGNIRENTIKELWHIKPSGFLKKFRELEPEKVEQCFTCKFNSNCPRCPGTVYLETGDVMGKSSIACIIAEKLQSD